MEMLAEGGMEKSVLEGSLSPDTQVVIISRLFERPVRRIPLESQFIIAWRQSLGRQPQLNGSACACSMSLQHILAPSFNALGRQQCGLIGLVFYFPFKFEQQL